MSLECFNPFIPLNDKDVLDRVAQSLKDWPEIRVEVAGHTDSTGSDGYNLDLSERRAKAVYDYLVGKGVDYRRVIFPGASFSNVVKHLKRNGTPRRAGDFMWRQAYWCARMGLDIFVANFDEFDEGTAIAKCAPDSRFVPRNQWFLTLDADGTHVSSDYYLRLTGDIAEMIRGERPIVFDPRTPYHETAP